MAKFMMVQFEPRDVEIYADEADVRTLNDMDGDFDFRSECEAAVVDLDELMTDQIEASKVFNSTNEQCKYDGMWWSIRAFEKYQKQTA